MARGASVDAPPKWISLGSHDGVDYRLVSRDYDDFWRNLEALISASFEPASLRPASGFRSLCPVSPNASPAFYPTFVAAYVGERLVSFAALEYFMEERAWYVWYMATAAEMRGRGIGSQLLQIIIDMAPHVFTQEGFETLAILAECEAPEHLADDKDEDWRRINFYMDAGFAPIPVSELAPPFGPGELEPVPYWLLVRSVRPLPVHWRAKFTGPWLRRMFEKSRLNGPNSMAKLCLAFSLNTLGHDPKPRGQMLSEWQTWKAQHQEADPVDSVDSQDASFDCTWLTPAAETQHSILSGYGAFAVRPISAGSVVGVVAGFVVDHETLLKQSESRIHRSIQVTATQYLMARELPEVGDLLNHSCNPNLGILGSQIFVAMRDIEPGEELTFDYAMCDASDYDEFRCYCGAPTCREIVTGSDWRDPALQAKYAGWFSSYLVRRIAALPTH